MTISSEPLAVASEQTGLHGRVTAYILEIRKRVSDGLTIAELCELTISAMRLAIACVDELNLEGSHKKQIVTDLAASLFDEFSPLLVPSVLRPVWWVVKPPLRSLVLALAAGAVEGLIPLVRSADE